MRNLIVRSLLLFVLLVSFANAQQYRSTLVGEVTDSQGAVIPNTKIVATSVETGAKSNAISGPSGEYALPDLLPGTYTISAESQGFEGYVNQNVVLTSNAHATLNIVMTVGATTQSVTVTSEALLLDNTSAAIEQPIQEAHLAAMPSIGRAPMGMAKQAFGVIDETNPSMNSRPFDTSGTSNYQMGGGSGADPNGYNEILLDGGENMWAPQMREVAWNPPLDVVQEVSAEVFSADASYGDGLGGTIEIVTKGGTDKYHGVVEEYNSPSALFASPHFVSAGFKKLPSSFDEWGFTLGGPLYIPKFLPFKNRVFFEFSYEGIKDTQSIATITTVPTAAMRTGDFSALLGLGSIYTIYDPNSGVASNGQVARQPFSYNGQTNVIPPGRISAIAQAYQAYYPLPNLTTANATGTNDYLANSTQNDDYFTVTPRMDIVFNDRHKLFWDYHGVYRTFYVNNYFPNVSTGDVSPTNGNGATVDDLYTISPSLVLNTRVNWTRLDEQQFPLATVAKFNPTTLGFPGYLAAASTSLTMPAISWSDSTQSLGFSRNLNDGAGFITEFDTYQAFASLTKIIGTHTIKFGADVRRRVQASKDLGFSSGSFSFGSGWVNGPISNSASASQGPDYAEFLLGLPTGGEFDLDTHSNAHMYYTGFFAQDDWRIKSNLTLNLGMRYEHETPTVVNSNHALNGFNFSAPNSVTAAAQAAYAKSPISQLPASQFNPVGGATYVSSAHPGVSSTYGLSFSPRVGFAYTPGGRNGKTVVRGGFGIFFGDVGVEGWQKPSTSYVEVPVGAYSQASYLVPTNNGYLTPYATLSNPFPTGITQPAGSAAGLNTFLGQSLTFMNPNLGASYSERWTLTAQQQITPTLVLELGYIGNRALHLPISENLDGIPAQFLATGNTRNQAVINAITANVPNPFQGLLPGTTLNGSLTTAGQLLQPYPQFAGTSGLIEADATIGTSDFNTLEVRLEKRVSHGLEFITSYERSKLNSKIVQLNPSTLDLTRMIDSTDRPNRLEFSGIYQLPIGRGRAFANGMNRWLDGALGGWQISGVETLQQAAPLKWGNVIYLGGDLGLNAHNPPAAFNKTVFNTTASQQLADNIITFPTYNRHWRQDAIEDFDSEITKTFRVKERYSFVFLAQAINTFNRVQYAAPNLTPTSTAFGTITSQANSPRAIQLSLRFLF